MPDGIVHGCVCWEVGSGGDMEVVIVVSLDGVGVLGDTTERFGGVYQYPLKTSRFF